MSDRRYYGAILLTALLGTAWFTHTDLAVNDGSRYSLTRALVTTGSAQIGDIYRQLKGRAGAVDQASYQGRIYSDKAPLGSFLAVPTLFAVRLLTHAEHWGIYACALTIGGLPTALLAVLLALLARRAYGASPWQAAALALALVFGTNCFYWSGRMMSHALSASLVLGSFALIRLGPATARAALLAGAVGGLAVSSDYYLLLILPLLGLRALARHGLRWTLAFTAGAALAGLFPAIYSWVLFDSPLVLPYRYGTHFDVHARQAYGIGLPRLWAVLEITIGGAYGLLLWNPVFLATLARWPAFFRAHRADALFALGVLAVLVAMLAGVGHRAYGIGWSWGPRQLVPAFALLMLPAALPWSRGSRAVFALALALSLAINVTVVHIGRNPPLYRAQKVLLRDAVPAYRAGGATLHNQLRTLRGEPPTPVSLALTAALYGGLLASWLTWHRQSTRGPEPSM